MPLKNKAQREQFLENYKAWGLWKEIPELELKFYRYEFPNGTVIIATEYASMKFERFGPRGHIYKKGTSVKYHLILEKSDNYRVEYSDNAHKLYNPVGDSITEIVTYLTETKPEIDTPENPSTADAVPLPLGQGRQE